MSTIKIPIPPAVRRRIVGRTVVFPVKVPVPRLTERSTFSHVIMPVVAPGMFEIAAYMQ
jgi:hypothetical protein